MFQLSCLILYLKRNRNQRIDVAWALRPGSHWSSSSVVPTCPRRSLLHVEASLPLRFLDLVTGALWPYSATVFFSLIKGAGVFHAPPPRMPRCCHPRFPFLWFLLVLYFLWEAFPWSPASVSTTQLFTISLLLSLLVVLRMLNSFLTYEFVSLMVFFFL